MNWIKGRQGGDYFKLKIWVSERFKFDIYILKFPQWSYVHDHKDPVPEGYVHNRLNIILKRARVGGFFYSVKDGKRVRTKKRVKLFQPSEVVHGMTQVVFGSSYWLSIGWLKRK